MPDNLQENQFIQTQFPFKSEDAERVILHPETPTSYVEWREIMPFINVEKHPYFGNLFRWSYQECNKTIGSSRSLFKRLFMGVDEDVLDEWMFMLSETPVDDFVDHHLPFMKNIEGLIPQHRSNDIIKTYLKLYKKSSTAVHRELSPSIIMVEATKSCNFTCSMCSSRTRGFREDRTLDLEDFGEIVRVLSPRVNTIRINGYGESTVIPNFIQYVNCLKEFNFEGIREIITNFSGPIEIYEELARRGFLLIVSWDATDPDLFEKIRHGSNYLTMLENLKKIGAELSKTPERLVLLSTIQKGNVHEIVPLVKLAKAVGAGMIIYNMVKESDGSQWMLERYSEITHNFAQAQEFAMEAGIGIKLPDHVGPLQTNLPGVQRTSMTRCDRPWSEVLIHWDTELTVCNMFNPYSYGMLFHSIIPRSKQSMEKRFEKLWNGPNASLFRTIINNTPSHTYCKECYFM